MWWQNIVSFSQVHLSLAGTVCSQWHASWSYIRKTTILEWVLSFREHVVINFDVSWITRPSQLYLVISKEFDFLMWLYPQPCLSIVVMKRVHVLMQAMCQLFWHRLWLVGWFSLWSIKMLKFRHGAKEKVATLHAAEIHKYNTENNFLGKEKQWECL